MLRPRVPAALRAEAVPLLFAGAFLVAAAVLALGFHPLEVAGGENDGYAQQAEQLLAGEVPRDIWHPLHYALLTAAATPLCGSTFTAAVVVSVLGGALLVFAGSALARRLGGPVRGAVAAALAGAILCVQGNLLVYSAQAASDVPALGVAAAALLLAARIDGAPRPRRAAFAAGVAGGFAAGMRYPIAAVVPALLVTALRQTSRARRAAVVLGGCALGYAPQAWLSWCAFGSPFHQENWRNLVLKVVWHYDPWAMGDARPYTGLGDVLAAHGLDVFGAGMRDLGGQLAGGLAQPCSGHDSVLLVLAIALGCGCAWRCPAGRAPVAFGVLYLLLLCTASIPTERWSLPLLLPEAVALAALPGFAARPWLAASPWSRAAAAVPALVCVALGVAALPARLSAFAAAHPTAEVAAAAALRGRLTALDGIAATYPSIRRHAKGRVFAIDPHAFAGLAGTALLDRMAELAQRMHFEFFVCGRVTGGEAFAALRALGGRSDHACVVEPADEFAVVRWRPPLAGVRGLAVEQAPGSTGTRFSVAIAGDELGGAPVLGAVLRADGPGAPFSLVLQGAGERFAADWPLPLAAGNWRFEPMLLLGDGSLRRGAVVERMVD